MVILLVGPAGSGKTAIGEHVAEHGGWVHVSEDDIWGEIGHPSHEPRTEAGQRLVHARARERMGKSLDAGLNVVFEFLVYENPPARISDYQDFLRSRGTRFVTRILRPSVESILERQRVRGRPSDHNVQRRRRQAEHQVACLLADLIDPEWVIDSSEETLDETYSRHFLHFVEAPADVFAPPDAAIDSAPW